MSDGLTNQLLERLARIEEKIAQVFGQNEERKQLLKDYMTTTDKKMEDLEKYFRQETESIKKYIEKAERDDDKRFSAKRVEWIMKGFVAMVLVALFGSILKEYIR